MYMYYSCSCMLRLLWCMTKPNVGTRLQEFISRVKTGIYIQYMTKLCTQHAMSQLPLAYCRNKVGELLTKVSSTRLHAQFAKAREADGHYQEAARAYETARDFDSAVRCRDDLYSTSVLCAYVSWVSGMVCTLQSLPGPPQEPGWCCQSGEGITIHWRSKDGGKVCMYYSFTQMHVVPLHHGGVASTCTGKWCVVIPWGDIFRFFQKMGDYSSALQFLVLSQCNDEAFAMAEVRCTVVHQCMTFICMPNIWFGY